MTHKKLLLVDCGMRETAHGLQRSDYAERTVMKLAEKHNFQLYRFVLLEHPDMGKKEIARLFSNGKVSGVIINGSAFLNPVPEFDGDGSGRFNSTVLRIIEHSFNSATPLLGICYGHLMLARFLGEGLGYLWRFGFVETELTELGQQHWTFVGVPSKLLTAQCHGTAMRAAKHSNVLARSGAVIQAITARNGRVEAIGLQFHADFHGDIDGNGTGAMRYFYENDAELRTYFDAYREFRPEQQLIEPEEPVSAYAMGNLPLLNFATRCLMGK